MLFGTLIFCFPLAASQNNYEWAHTYFNGVNENTDVHEIVEMMITLRNSMVSEGYQVPTVTTLLLQYKQSLEESGIHFDSEEFEEIYVECASKEHFIDSSTMKHHHKHKHKNKNKDKKEEVKINSKTTFGLLKCVVGGLMCLLPVPGVQTAGVALFGLGISDMMDGAKEQGDENEKTKKYEEFRVKQLQKVGFH